MDHIIIPQKLTKQACAPFGDILSFDGMPDKMINQGQCGRYHDKARLQFHDGQAGISLFEAEPRSLPYYLDMMERHPLGSQAFIPMTSSPFLITVAGDKDGAPDKPLAFITPPSMGINYHANIWHGVLTPLEARGHFAVIDRIGDGANLEEFWFQVGYKIVK